MKKQTQEKSRLSGWVRLWIVCTVLSWIAGALDVALSTEPFRFPLPLREASAQSIRHMLWFLTPILFAAGWISIRWVWRGFRPPLGQAAMPQMATRDVAKRTLEGTAVAVGGLLLGLFWLVRLVLALGAFAIAAALALALPYLYITSDMPSSLWVETALVFHAFLFFKIGAIFFKDIMGISDA